jgi:DNA-binding CsgD family transcriptional regulator
MATFDELGAVLWSRQSRGEIDRLGLRRAPDRLTESERRVAELAAGGLTNREVAQRLFVSPKTVEANLGRVYRKLGVHSRAQLALEMLGRGSQQT